MDHDVLALLWSQLEESKERYREAKEKRREAFGNADESAADLPRLEDSLLIRRAIAEDSRARREYFEAMTRLNRYLLDRIVPDDIKVILSRKSKSSGAE